MRACVDFSAKEEARLELALAERVIEKEARSEIVAEGTQPEHIFVVKEGWACQYRTLHDGRRQVTAILLPGDLCCSHMFVLKEADVSVSTLTPLVVSALSRQALSTLVSEIPDFSDALWWQALMAASIQREWTVSVGRRDSTERMAHLLCELFVRLRMVGLADADAIPMPMTQMDMADALGITNVHINRTLQSMRAKNLIRFDRRRWELLDLAALKRIAMFEDNYLHVRPGCNLDIEPSDPCVAVRSG